jgi:hypothetical protein
MIYLLFLIFIAAKNKKIMEKISLVGSYLYKNLNLYFCILQRKYTVGEKGILYLNL